MLNVEMQLASPEACSRIPPHLVPVAKAEVDFQGDRKQVRVTLKGVIEGESVNALRRFLKDVSSFRATKWILQMENLQVLSGRGIQMLVKFSRIIRKRGHAVEIHGMHKNLYATLEELEVLKEFQIAD